MLVGLKHLGAATALFVRNPAILSKSSSSNYLLDTAFSVLLVVQETSTFFMHIAQPIFRWEERTVRKVRPSSCPTHGPDVYSADPSF